MNFENLTGDQLRNQKIKYVCQIDLKQLRKWGRGWTGWEGERPMGWVGLGVGWELEIRWGGK